MKKTIIAICIFAVSFCALAATEIVDGITWNYTVEDGKASITSIPKSTAGAVTIPSTLGGYPVTSIGDDAFSDCSGLTSVTIPNSVTNIGRAFRYCSGLSSVVIPERVTSIAKGAFFGCHNFTSFFVDSNNQFYSSTNGLLLSKDGKTLIEGINCDTTIPDGVISIGDSAFCGCINLTSVVIPDSVTSIEFEAFWNCSDLTSVVIPDSVTNIGAEAFAFCNSLSSVTIPESVCSFPENVFAGCDRLWTSWYRALANLAANSGNQSGDPAGGTSGERITLVTTNIVLHYVTQSLSSDAVIPPMESGIVNVITEVGAGRAVAIPSDWAAQYPDFTEKFGNDFGAAITAQTGKRDGSGNPMFVWQDFVAGTDPTNPDDVFTASITFDATTGEPIVSWSPELSAAEAAKRSYTTYGKVRLTDPDWTPIDGDEADYNFFKVEVKMK